MFFTRTTGLFGILVIPALLCPAAVGLRKGPYLIYSGSATEMQVLWQLDTTQVCTLEWGRDANCSEGTALTNEYGSDHQHSYIIRSLCEGARYHYRVTDGSANTYSGDFVTAPNESSKQVKFLAYGDTRSNPWMHDAVCDRILDTLSRDPGYQTLLLHTGDWTTDDNELNWDLEYFPSYSTHAREVQSRLAIAGCKGNHEEPTVAFAKYWPYPCATGANFYWSFDYGPCHFTVVDQYIPYTPPSQQYEWLVNDLSASTAAWKFLVFHEPGYSAGGHDNNTDVQHYIQPLCELYGIDIVFCGHNHYYAQCDVRGVKHITTGGGGAILYPPDPSYPFVVSAAFAHHFCEVEVVDYRLHFVSREAGGSVLDEFTLYHPIPADFSSDNRVDGGDLLLFAQRWLNDDCLPANNFCDGTDMDRLGNVNMADYAIFAGYWHREIAP
jgi:hypothetical protein